MTAACPLAAYWEEGGGTTPDLNVVGLSGAFVNYNIGLESILLVTVLDRIRRRDGLHRTSDWSNSKNNQTRDRFDKHNHGPKQRCCNGVDGRHARENHGADHRSFAQTDTGNRNRNGRSKRAQCDSQQ